MILVFVKIGHMKRPRLRHLMFLLSLLAALAGTPLRLVEAANDLAFALAELGVDVDSDIEPTDGGIGDDSDATIKSNIAHVSISLAIANVLPQHFFLSPPSWRSIDRRVDEPPRSAATLPRRLALLQCFLC